MAVVADIAVNRIIVKEFFTFRALGVEIIAARIANVDIVAVLVDSVRKFTAKKIFVAFVANAVIFGKATRANIGAVMYHSHLAFVVVFFAMFAKTVVFVKAMVADVNAFAVAIDDFPSFGAIVLALLTKFAFFGIAIGAVNSFGNFVGASNAKPVSSDIKSLEVVSVVGANGNFCVEVGMRPISITAEAVSLANVNVVLVAAIFFGQPEIGNVFEFGQFALNQIAIKF